MAATPSHSRAKRTGSCSRRSSAGVKSPTASNASISKLGTAELNAFYAEFPKTARRRGRSRTSMTVPNSSTCSQAVLMVRIGEEEHFAAQSRTRSILIQA